MTRFQIEGSITKYGFFEEYTKESIDFDTDAELEMHINSEMVKGANEMTEDMIQMDLLAGAGVIRYGGIATVDSEVSGEAGEVSVIDYNDLMRLEIDLDNNRCPKNTKVITGSRMIDTKVIDGARYIYVGSEMIPSLKKMTDNFANQAFISVANYASAGNVARGEIGSIGGFRVIVVPEMLHWAGAGKAVTTNTGYRETNNAYDIYPMLVVGSGSFTTIGFQTDGKTTKFKIKHVKPESEVSYSSADPFGEMGFMSIKWYYGSMILRPERIALVKTVAEY
jgi:N4-gp56 family major capsid protein